MFGYILVNEKELTPQMRQDYRSLYCGLCRSLRQRHGLTGQAALNYDFTFLALLLTALYSEEGERQAAIRRYRCPLHPTKPQLLLVNEYTAYAADMAVMLAYFQCMDHWTDDRSSLARAEAALLRRQALSQAPAYPRQYQAVTDYLQRLAAVEAHGETDPEIPAALTGHMLAQLVVFRRDEWADDLADLGFGLGRFIYLMDAYDDVERDRKRGRYNPFLPLAGQPELETQAEALLTAAMADCAHAFERLPVLELADLVRNIIYSGVWSRFELTQSKRRKGQEHGPI